MPIGLTALSPCRLLRVALVGLACRNLDASLFFWKSSARVGRLFLLLDTQACSLAFQEALAVAIMIAHNYCTLAFMLAIGKSTAQGWEKSC